MTAKLMGAYTFPFHICWSSLSVHASHLLSCLCT